jgi:formamidopyrimidine-DNA glycosylase
MPELPEVETTVRGLERVLDGHRIARVEARRPDLRRALPVDLGQRLTGARITGLGRRAKYGVIGTDRGDSLIFHLGMSGRWRVDPTEIEKHDHFILDTDEGRRVALNDPRRFGSLDLVRSDKLDEWPPFAALGPEPLDIRPEELKRRLAGRTASIKLLLLDQRIIAGLGNIYVCEVLHRAGLSPRRAAGTLSRRNGAPSDSAHRLAAVIPQVLHEAVAAGGSSLRDHRQTDGTLGYFQHRFRVYDREGEPCPTPGCSGTIRRIVQSARSTFFCSVCQR